MVTFSAGAIMRDTAEVPFAARRRATIEKAIEIFSTDDRFVAGWLEGSLADGSADPYSDIDLYLCIGENWFESMWEKRREIIERIAPILASLDIRGIYGIGCLLEGPVKLDVFFERESTLGAKTRIAVNRLWGPPAIFQRIRIGDDLGDAAIRAALETNVMGLLQGATWPLRLIARGQLNTFFYGELLLVETALVPLMLLESDRRAFHRNMFTRAKLLNSAQSAECARLIEQITAAVQSRDGAAMRDVHIEIFRKLCSLSHEAFARYGIEFPPHIEDATVDFYNQEWPLPR